MVYYFEAGLCLASTYLGYRAVTPPNAPPKESIASSENDLKKFLLHGALVFWQVVPALSGLAQTYFLLRNPEQRIPWRREFNASMALMISGALTRLACYKALDKSFTFELSVTEGQKVVDKGPYSIVRHPSYLALFPFLSGNFYCFMGPFNVLCTLLPTRTVDLGALAKLHSSLSHPSLQNLVRAGLAALSTFAFAVYAKTFLARIPEEESMLESKLGQDYKQYKKKVPYRILPYVW